jgi:hypothetical protein
LVVVGRLRGRNQRMAATAGNETALPDKPSWWMLSPALMAVLRRRNNGWSLVTADGTGAARPPEMMARR